jgi:hypothetical protein
MDINLNDLMVYTEWERTNWQRSFQQLGEAALESTIGAHGDGRVEKVRDLIKHVFTAERRYVERLRGQPLTDPSSVPAHPVDVLFEFGQKSGTPHVIFEKVEAPKVNNSRTVH